MPALQLKAKKVEKEEELEVILEGATVWVELADSLLKEMFADELAEILEQELASGVDEADADAADDPNSRRGRGRAEE